MTNDFGVYVHVPFCRARCDYCAFATYTDRDPLMDRYVAACVSELAARRAAGDLADATSVFFGGGTPSRLPADGLVRILEAIPRAPGAEVTVECNPEDAAGCLATYRAGGVTRISLGVQSVHDHVLASLGRTGGPATVRAAVRELRALDFSSWNLDVIFGAVGESDEDWERTLAALLDFAPPHISAYALTVEPGTPLARDRDRHPDDDVQAHRYERAEAVLSAAGYRWEEVSNWARPGHECRHNRLYWRQGDYLGIGSAAHSHRSGRRWWNIRTPDRYIEAIESGRSPVAGSEVLGPAEREFEALALALRTADGVPDGALPDAADLDGLVQRRAGQAVLTVRGRLLANLVSTYLESPSEPLHRSRPGLGVNANR